MRQNRSPRGNILYNSTIYWII